MEKLPVEILTNSPSKQSGISEHDEREHRFFGCELIQEAGILLRLPQVVMVTGQTIFHRFFYQESFSDYDAFQVAMASIFLSAKVEERPKRIRTVLNVFYAMFQRRQQKNDDKVAELVPFDLNGGLYSVWREELIATERRVLIRLGFGMYNIMDYPHKYILYFVKVLDGSQELAQSAWNYLNDTLRIDICTRYSAESIACAAIYLASRVVQEPLPSSPPWWELFDTTKENVEEIAIQIMRMYQQEPISWLRPLSKDSLYYL